MSVSKTYRSRSQAFYLWRDAGFPPFIQFLRSLRAADILFRVLSTLCGAALRPSYRQC